MFAPSCVIMTDTSRNINIKIHISGNMYDAFHSHTFSFFSIISTEFINYKIKISNNFVIWFIIVFNFVFKYIVRELLSFMACLPKRIRPRIAYYPLQYIPLKFQGNAIIPFDSCSVLFNQKASLTDFYKKSFPSWTSASSI